MKGTTGHYSELEGKLYAEAERSGIPKQEQRDFVRQGIIERIGLVCTAHQCELHPELDRKKVINETARVCAEMDRRTEGDFDGLLGDFRGDHAILLTQIQGIVRNYLLERYDDETAYKLLEEYSKGRTPLVSATAGLSPTRKVPVGDDVLLALQLVNLIRTALARDTDKQDWLIYGRAGKRDKAREAGATEGAARSARQRQARAWNEWGESCVNEAKNMLTTGYHARYELPGILSRKYRKSERTIRNLLKTHLDNDNKKAE